MLGKILLLGTLLLGVPVLADDDTVEAAIGGGVGGAVGAAVGEKLGDREGAIVGAAIGAAAGAAVATSDDDKDAPRVQVERDPDDLARFGHPHVRHCPPGQAKKGRC